MNGYDWKRTPRTTIASRGPFLLECAGKKVVQVNVYQRFAPRVLRIVPCPYGTIDAINIGTQALLNGPLSMALGLDWWELDSWPTVEPSIGIRVELTSHAPRGHPALLVDFTFFGLGL